MATYVRGRGIRRLSDAEIAELYRSGLDSDSIAARAQCSGTTVLAIARAAGVEIRKPGNSVYRKLNLSTDEIVARYKDGQSGPVIADAAGTTANTIYKLLHRAGVQRRPPGSSAEAAAAAARARRRGGTDGR